MKYNVTHNFELCEKCEENSKVLYEMKNMKLCPRCILEHLSFYFSSLSKESLKFYIVDIIFHQLNEHDFPQKSTNSWIKINTVVDYTMNNEILILEQKRKEDTTCNLFVIANEIIWKSFDQKNLVKRRKCFKCSKNRFNLIKSDCCKIFICLSCLVKVQNRKCVMCQTEMYRTKKQLHELVNTMCLTIYKTFRLIAPEKLIRKTINEQIILQDKKVENKNQLGINIKIIIDYIGFHQLGSWFWSRILEPEGEVYKTFSLSDTETMILHFISALSQILCLFFTNPETLMINAVWVGCNMYYSKTISNIKNTWTLKTITDKNEAKIIKFTSEIEKTLITLFNFVAYFLVGAHIDASPITLFYLLLYSIMSTALATFYSNLLQKYLQKLIKKEQRYEFF